GQSPLEIWLESSTCSCTIAKLKGVEGPEGEIHRTVVIEPGASKPIEVSWDTKHWVNFAHSATIGTNDSTHRSITLAIMGKVQPSVIVHPSSVVDFGMISDEETREARITVFSGDWPQLKLTKLATSKPGLIVATSAPMTAEVAEKLKAQGGYRVTLEIKP